MRRRSPLLLALLVVAACGSSGKASPSASVTRPPTSNRPATVEQQVEAAYLRSWDVYAKAMLELDPGGLSESYAPPQLERTTGDVTARKSDGRPARIVVEHDYRVVELRSDLALVSDHYRNHSVLLDPDTRNPVEADPDQLVVEKYTLREIDGRWKVVDIERS
jgi:hypothetical protein